MQELANIIPWNELVRHPLQTTADSKEKLSYWKAAAKIKQEILQNYADYSSFSSWQFVKHLDELHSHLAGMHAFSMPKLRPYAYQNCYPKEVFFTGIWASILQDPFSYEQNSHTLKLEGISEAASPRNKKFKHYYPEVSCLHLYNKKAHEHLLAFYKKELLLSERLLHLIQMYRYLINARPYFRHNNSLFMILVNTLLSKVSLKGLPHLIFDHFAHRLSLCSFTNLFLNCLIEKNPHLGVFQKTSTQFQKTFGKAYRKMVQLRQNANLHTANFPHLFSRAFSPLLENSLSTEEKTFLNGAARIFLLSKKELSKSEQEKLLPFPNLPLPEPFCLLKADSLRLAWSLEKSYINSFELELKRIPIEKCPSPEK